MSSQAPTPQKSTSPPKVLATLDGRYIVVKGRLWRAANPGLAKEVRASLVKDLMDSRREVGRALRAKDLSALAIARSGVQRAKEALGERGPVWWTNGEPDLNRMLAKNTPYAEWFTHASRLPHEPDPDY